MATTTAIAGEAQALRRRADVVQRGAVRAAVLGVNDGLVTNVCLVLALAGANAGRGDVRAAGLASLLAGAVSMAAGEWLSVRAQVEVLQGLLGDLRSVAARASLPRLLWTSFRRIGMDERVATLAAEEVAADRERGLEVAARAVMGVDPGGLGSPWTAALTSFVLFAVGAAVPIVPWLVTGGGRAVVASVVMTGAAAVIVGAALGRTSGRPVGRTAFRQLAIMLVAAGVTYAVGALFDASVS